MINPQTNHEKYLQLELLQICLKCMELGASIADILNSLNGVVETINKI